MNIENPKFIQSRFGRMFIIEHYVNEPMPKYWVISLNSGLQCRTGPRRLYLQFARNLSQMGIGVVRVDLAGVGDSDGPIPATHFDMHHPEDVQTVIDYVRKKHNPDGIILQGLCAGSRVAIKAAAENPDVKGVLAWSTTIYTSSPGSTRAPEVPKHGVSKAGADYTKDRISRILKEARFLRLSFWRELFASGDFFAELRTALWSVWILLRQKDSEDFRGQFIGSLQSYVNSKRPILFVYGEKDQLCLREFKDLELDIPSEDVVVIPEGTHTFSTISQRDKAIEGTCGWVRNKIRVMQDSGWQPESRENAGP